MTKKRGLIRNNFQILGFYTNFVVDILLKTLLEINERITKYPWLVWL